LPETNRAGHLFAERKGTVARRDLIAAAKRSDAALEFENGIREGNREYGTIARRSLGWYPADHRADRARARNLQRGEAVVHGDLRALTVDQIQKTQQKMRDIAAKSLPKTTAQVEFTDVYPPMPPTPGNRALLDVLNQVNRDLGFPTMKRSIRRSEVQPTCRSWRRTRTRSPVSACSEPERTRQPSRRSSIRFRSRSREQQA
jgi:hypothetical protein